MAAKNLIMCDKCKLTLDASYSVELIAKEIAFYTTVDRKIIYVCKTCVENLVRQIIDICANKED